MASASGRARARSAATSAHERPAFAISVSLSNAASAWFSSAPPRAIATLPVNGSLNSEPARPSQKSSSAQSAPKFDGVSRGVTCGAGAEQRVRPRPAVAVERDDARRAHDVVDRAFVDAGVARRARIRAAGGRAMARAASDAAVARQLLVPEQDLAEHALRLGDRVLGGHRHGRQVRGKRRARREGQHEHKSAASRHSAHSNGLAGAGGDACRRGSTGRSGRGLESSHAAPTFHAPMRQRHVEDVARRCARRLAAARRVVCRHRTLDTAAHANGQACAVLRRRSELRRRRRVGGRCRLRAVDRGVVRLSSRPSSCFCCRRACPPVCTRSSRRFLRVLSLALGLVPEQRISLTSGRLANEGNTHEDSIRRAPPRGAAVDSLGSCSAPASALGASQRKRRLRTSTRSSSRACRAIARPASSRNR